MGGGGSTPETFDRAASTKRAGLVRDQWEDYKIRFQPEENQLIRDMGNGIHTRFNEEGLANAQKGVDTAFKSANDSQYRDLSRFGLDMNAKQNNSYNTSMDIAKSKAEANAVNTANQYDVDRRNAVMTGGLSNASALGRG